MTPARVAARRVEAEDAWSQLEGEIELTSEMIHRRTGLSRARAREVLRSWEARGMIHHLRRQKNKKIYRRGPRSAALDGPRDALAAKAGPDKRRNLWRAMHGLGTFSPRDLARVCSASQAPVTEREAQAFCQALLKGEYLRVLEAAQPGLRLATYLLARRTGPVPPAECRVPALWDENLGAYTYVAGLGVTA